MDSEGLLHNSKVKKEPIEETPENVSTFDTNLQEEIEFCAVQEIKQEFLFKEEVKEELVDYDHNLHTDSSNRTVSPHTSRTAYNRTMEKQADEPEDFMNEPLPSMSEPMEVQDAVASTLATPFVQPIIAASKLKAQRQREYRQRIAASRTPAQAAAARKSKNERQRRLRQARSQRQHAQQQSTTTADQPDKRVNLTNEPLFSVIPAPMEVQDAVASTLAMPFAQPIIAASKSKAQRQREYRQRIAASRTPAQAAAARKSKNERQRRLRQARSQRQHAQQQSTTTADQPDERVNLTNEPLFSVIPAPMEVQDAVASTLAMPFAQPIIAASKSKAQRQREYRQRIAASRTPAQAAAARKSQNERQRRLRQAIGQRQHVQQQSTTTADQPDEGVNLTNEPLFSVIPAPMEVQGAVASTLAMPFAQPIIAASKSKAQRQREYRQRITASRTPAEVAAARKSKNERQRRLRQARRQQQHEQQKSTTTADQPDERVNLTNKPLFKPIPAPMEVQGVVASTLATLFAQPIIAASKSKAQRQREYRQRIAASRTPAQAAAARKSKNERQRRFC